MVNDESVVMLCCEMCLTTSGISIKETTTPYMQLNKVAGWSLCFCPAGSTNFTRGTCHENICVINMGYLLTLLLYRWRAVLRLQWCGVRARWTVVWATVLRHVHNQAALLFPPAVAPCLDHPLLTPAGRFFNTFACTCRLYRYFVTKNCVLLFKLHLLT